MLGEDVARPHEMSFAKMAELAMAEGDEGWDAIDRDLPVAAQNPKFVIEAAGNLRHENDDVRDLAASVFEATAIEPGPEVRLQLRDGMQTDSNPYTRYRSAFALFRHGDRSEEVVKVIKDAAEDPETNEPAERYLDQLKTEQSEDPEA